MLIGTPLQRMNKMAEVFGLKPIGRIILLVLRGFANVTANKNVCRRYD